ncbi:MAG: hypothetical protein ABIJ46_02050 [bacterium]
MSEMKDRGYHELGPEEVEEERPIEREIGARYDQLLEERQELVEGLKKFTVREYSVCLRPDIVGQEAFEDAVAEWKERVKKEVDLFRPLERLGIDVFADDLTVQPGFLDHQIVFKSRELLEEQVRYMRSVGGLARTRERRVDVDGPEPDMSQRMLSILFYGRLDDSIGILVHELIHRRHLGKRPNIDGELTEAQAYFSGLLIGERPNFGLAKTAETLVKPKDERGLYEYDPDRVNEVLMALAELYGLGLGEDEIGDLLVESRFDAQSERYLPLMGRLEQLKEQRGLTDEADAMALYDLYRLHAANQRMRVRLALFEVLDRRFSRDERLGSRRDLLRREFFSPEYCINGRPVQAGELDQKIVVPCNDKYPYDPDGRRTGIIFGFFPAEGKDDVEFGLGRLEIDGLEGQVALARKGEDAQEILEDFRSAVKTVDPKLRFELVLNFWRDDLLHEGSLATEMARAMLVTDEDHPALVKLISDQYSERVEIMLGDALAISESWRRSQSMERKRLRGYAEAIDSLNLLQSLLGVDFDSQESFSEDLKLLRRTIDEALAWHQL